VGCFEDPVIGAPRRKASLRMRARPRARRHLLPGDLIFTGTPAGIGWARDPKVVLRPGDRLVTHAEVIGEMTTTFTAA
jgi:hypothetical protein